MVYGSISQSIGRQLIFGGSRTLDFRKWWASKNKHRNKLNLTNSLRLKITKIDVDANNVINHNRKQAHISYTPHY